MKYFVQFNGSQLGLLYRIDAGVTHLTSAYINLWISLNNSYMHVEIDE